MNYLKHFSELSMLVSLIVGTKVHIIARVREWICGKATVPFNRNLVQAKGRSDVWKSFASPHRMKNKPVALPSAILDVIVIFSQI